MGKQVVQQRKKRTREDHERERVQEVADAADRQGSLRIRDPQAQGSHSSGYVAQGVRVSQRQLRPHLSPALDHGLEVVVLSGERAVPSSSTPTVALRQAVWTVERSFPRLSYWISGGYQGPK